jgi:universal stress protein E
MRLLCATDLSPKCEFAIDRAGRLAEDLRMDLSLLHVVSAVESERALEESLNAAIDYMKARARPPMWQWGGAPNVIVGTGSPARIISQTVQRLSPFALVVGPSKPGRLGRALFSRPAIEGSCPVLVVQRLPKTPYRNVLLAMDTSASSVRAMQTAEVLLAGTAASTKIVHAYEPPYRGMLWYVGTHGRGVESYGNSWKNEASIAMSDLLKRYSRDFTRYEILVEDAKPAAAILRAVEEQQPDLLVLGARTAGAVQRAFTGSVTSEVIHKVRCDVLVVPAGKVLKDAPRPPARNEKTARRRALDPETPPSSFG